MTGFWIVANMQLIEVIVIQTVKALFSASKFVIDDLLVPKIIQIEAISTLLIIKSTVAIIIILLHKFGVGD